MRLFIAIRLSEDMREAVGCVQASILRRGVRGNYTPKENLHLTLAFIGEYHDQDQVLEVLSAVPMTPFRLTLDGIGAFGDLWWIGLETSDDLKKYVRNLRHALAEADVPFDKKRFTPHITILRKATGDMSKLAAIEPQRVGMTVKHISLMRSDRGKNGMIYTEIL